MSGWPVFIAGRPSALQQQEEESASVFLLFGLIASTIAKAKIFRLIRKKLNSQLIVSVEFLLESDLESEVDHHQGLLYYLCTEGRKLRTESGIKHIFF